MRTHQILEHARARTHITHTSKVGTLVRMSFTASPLSAMANAEMAEHVTPDDHKRLQGESLGSLGRGPEPVRASFMISVCVCVPSVHSCMHVSCGCMCLLVRMRIHAHAP